MKVTFLLSYEGNLWFGGTQVQADFTARELRALGVDVEFFTPLSTSVGDVAHCFGCYRYYLPVAEFCRQRGVPYVCSPVHFLGHSRLGLWWWHLKARTIRTDVRPQRRLLRGASLLLPNSRAEGQQVCALFDQPAAKLHVTPNGVEERFAHAGPDAFRSAFGIREPFVLNAGRLEPRKNQLRLIRALEGTGIPLVILGQEAHSAYAQECRRTAGPNVRFIPPIPHDDPLLASAYAACRVFALPSLLETPGIASLEAGAAGARVVTTPVGGGEEYFGKHARYPNPLSVADIRTKLLQAWETPSDPDAQRAHLLGRFSWRRVAERTLEAYQAAGRAV